MVKCLNETSGRAFATISWTDLTALNCFMKVCWGEQIGIDPGILELKMALPPDARDLGLRSTPIDSLFGSAGTKAFEALLYGVASFNMTSFSKNQNPSLRGWAARARFGNELPCAGEPCVARAADQRGKHVMLEGEQLKLSVQHTLRFNTTTGALLYRPHGMACTA